MFISKSLLSHLTLLYNNFKEKTLYSNTPDECVVCNPPCRVGQILFEEPLRYMKENGIAHEIPSPYANEAENQELVYYRIDMKAFEGSLSKLLQDDIGNNPLTLSLFEHVENK